MRLLLDTHVFPWAVAGSASLRSKARKTIGAAEPLRLLTADPALARYSELVTIA